MKTTVEIPGARQTRKPVASELSAIVSQTLAEKLPARKHEDKSWSKSFGKLHSLHEETMRIDRIIHVEFEAD